MKLYEEFREYDSLWEGPQEELNEANPHLWTMPDGTKVDLSDKRNISKERDRYLELTKGKSVKYLAHSVFSCLVVISDCLDRIVKSAPHKATVEKRKKENQRIIDRLSKFTDIASKVDLNDVLDQLNTNIVGIENKALQDKIDKANAELISLYNF